MKAIGIAAASAFGLVLAAHGTTSFASDQDFVSKAGQGGMMEVELGHTAMNQGESQAVKDFGQRMVTDHSKANESLKTAAMADGLTMPPALSSEQNATTKKLSAKQGAKFDKAYSKDMVADHKEDIKLFEKEAKMGTSPQVKAFAEATLPTLREHLKMAEALGTSGDSKM